MWQWCVQDLKEVGALLIVRKSLSHAPKTLTMPLANAFLKIAGLQRKPFWPNSDEKELFREQILDDSKFIVGSGYQLS